QLPLVQAAVQLAVPEQGLLAAVAVLQQGLLAVEAVLQQGLPVLEQGLVPAVLVQGPVPAVPWAAQLVQPGQRHRLAASRMAKRPSPGYLERSQQQQFARYGLR